MFLEVRRKWVLNSPVPNCRPHIHCIINGAEPTTIWPLLLICRHNRTRMLWHSHNKTRSSSMSSVILLFWLIFDVFSASTSNVEAHRIWTPTDLVGLSTLVANKSLVLRCILLFVMYLRDKLELSTLSNFSRQQPFSMFLVKLERCNRDVFGFHRVSWKKKKRFHIPTGKWRGIKSSNTPQNDSINLSRKYHANISHSCFFFVLKMIATQTIRHRADVFFLNPINSESIRYIYSKRNGCICERKNETQKHIKGGTVKPFLTHPTLFLYLLNAVKQLQQK